MNDGEKDFWRLLVAYFFPPAAVYMQVGATQPFWINLILTLALL